MREIAGGSPSLGNHLLEYTDPPLRLVLFCGGQAAQPFFERVHLALEYGDIAQIFFGHLV